MSGPALPRLQPPPGDAVGRWRLGHEPASAALARRLVSQALASASQPVAEQVQRRAVLATSELVTNAVRHARQPVDLEVRRTPVGWVVAVTDGTSVAPSPRRATLLDETGRGLLILERAGSRTGWAPTEQGKVVWVELRDVGGGEA